MNLYGKTDEELQILLEETELEYNEIRNSGRDTYAILWKYDYVRGEVLRRKLKLAEKKLVELVTMTQDSIRTQNKILENWDTIKKGADEATYQYYKTLSNYERDLQTAIHLQINQRPTSAAMTLSVNERENE
jgi:hypothetical protein